MTSLKTTGIASSWDGRIFIGSTFESNKGGGNTSLLQVYLFSPEALQDQASTQPFFNQPDYTPIAMADVPLLVGVTMQSPNPKASPTPMPLVGIDCGLDKFVSLAMVPSGGVDNNPFSSDQYGNRVNGCAGKTCYETYAFKIVTTRNVAYVDPQTCRGVQNRPLTVVGSGTNDPYLYQFPAFVVVQNPRTALAKVVGSGPGYPGGNSAKTFNQLPNATSLRQTPDGHAINAVEPSVSVDGHFMVMNTDLDVNFNQVGIGHVYYSYNEHSGAAGGWSAPLPLENASLKANDVISIYQDDKTRASVRFGDIFPIANQPLLQMNGVPFQVTKTPDQPQIRGAYPWLTLDASDIFWVSSINRSGMSVMGQHTAYGKHHLDNWINGDRGFIERFFTFTPGPIPGMWNQMRGNPNPQLPFFPGKAQTVPIFSADTSQYQEFSFANAMDGNYSLYLEMNELLDFDQAEINAGFTKVDNIFAINETPDSSGHYNVGTLVGEAQFPHDVFNFDGKSGGEYYTCLDGSTNQKVCPNGYAPKSQTDASWKHAFEEVSISGQAVYLGATGAIVVPDSSSMHFSASPGFTAEVWVNQLANSGGAASILNKLGSFTLSLSSGGTMAQSSVILGTTAHPVPLSSNRISLVGSGWTHLAFTYSPASGILNTFMNGVLADTVTAAAPMAMVDTTASLLIGPGSFSGPVPGEIQWNPNKPVSPIKNPILMVDEVKLSSIVRSPQEIAASALLPATANGNQSQAQLTLPLGLSAADLRMPASETLTPAVISLGQQMFFDRRLSGTETVSCSSCHSPQSYLTDPGVISTGITGIALPRNAPSLFNRAFSTAQMWDGAAPSLETQVLMPLFHPNEMGTNSAALAQLVNDIPQYKNAIVSNLNETPSASNISSIMGTVMASFQRFLLTGNSPVDQYIANPAANPPFLSGDAVQGLQIFTGKGRCVACHSNSNYTDESFHRSILFGSSLYPSTVCNTAGADTGLEDVTLNSGDCGKIKTPSLRNVATFGHYFHNSAVGSENPSGDQIKQYLATIVATYNQGPAIVIGLPADPELRPLGLDAVEQADLVAFLVSLTSTDPIPPSLKPPPVAPLSNSAATQQVVQEDGTLQNRTCDLAAIGHAPNTAFTKVSYVYCLIVLRNPVNLQLDNLANSINAGKLTVQKLLDAMFGSDEFMTQFTNVPNVAQMTNSNFVYLIYELLLFRSPTANELNAAVSQMNAGASQQAIFDQIVQGSDFAAENTVLF